MASLQDFFFADAAKVGGDIDIPLPSGEPSGEKLSLYGPESDEAVKASRAFMVAYHRATAELEPLRKKCEAEKDFLEFNIAFEDTIAPLNRDLAAALVRDWTLTDPCTPENRQLLMTQYKALVKVVIDAHNKARDELEEK